MVTIRNERNARNAQGNWLAASWLRIFYTELIDEDKRMSASFGAILNFAVILSAGLLFYPIAAVADGIYDGVFRVMMAGCVFVLVLSMPIMYIISLGNTCYVCVIFGHLMINFGVAMFGAPMTAWMTLKFPVSLRYSALAIAYNLSQMLFGGIAPFLATAMSCSSGYRLLGGLLFVFAAVISLAAVIVGDKSTMGRRAFIEALEEHDKADGGHIKYESVQDDPSDGVPVQRSDATRIRSTSSASGGINGLGSPQKQKAGRLSAHVP